MTTPAHPQKTSTLAAISLVSGILGVTMLPFTGSLIAVLAGHLARREIAASRGTLSGDGLALVGILLGYFAILAALLIACLGLLLLIFLLLALAALPSIATSQALLLGLFLG